jgi:hypothetical protein
VLQTFGLLIMLVNLESLVSCIMIMPEGPALFCGETIMAHTTTVIQHYLTHLFAADILTTEYPPMLRIASTTHLV